MSAQQLQEVLWQDLFADRTQWWDNNSRSKKSPGHPELRHKKSNGALWLNDWYKPAWVDTEVAKRDAGMRRPWDQVCPGRVGPCKDDLEVGTCRKMCENGQITEAVTALKLLVQRGCHIPDNLFYRVLKRCIALKDLVLGRRIHALTVDSGYEGNAFLATQLIGLYASHGSLEEAMQVFAKVTPPSVYNWASIIFAYAKHGEPKRAIELYQQMLVSTVKPDNRIFVAVLTACASAGDLATGKGIHAQIRASPVKPDIFVQTCLVDMYAKCGLGQEALSLYSSMQQEGTTRPSSVTFVCLLQACAGVGVAALHQGKELHAQIEQLGVQDDVVVGASLVNMYAKCGSLEDARRVFDGLPQKNVVTWNTMIAGYAQQGKGQEALDLYSSLQQEGSSPPDAVTYSCLLQACATVGATALQQGKQLHVQIDEWGLQADVVVGNSLVNMYVKCGSLEDARSLFHTLLHRDVVTWTAMIAGYAQQGRGEEALSLYSCMQREGGTPPDAVTFVCLLQACASVATLPLGKQLHAQIEERGLQADVAVGNSLVNMYAKCGNMGDAQQVFDSLPERDIVGWSALIAGYTHQGDSESVFESVQRMTRDGIQPNGITFLSVLTVCSHVGLVDKGRNYFEAMSTDYGITPTMEHYTCMLDLLSRAGYLDEALQMMKTMPFQPNGAMGLTVLGGCRKWSNLKVGRQAFEFAVRLDEKDAAPYVLMSNIYAGAQMWEKAKEMQARRMKFGAWKQPGQSWWTDMDGVVHRFLVADKKHNEIESLYGSL